MVDAVAALTFDLTSTPPNAPTTAVAPASVFDIAHFESVRQAQTSTPNLTAVANSTSRVAPASSGGFETALRTLDSLSRRSDGLGVEALRFAAEHKRLTPGEMLAVTVHAQQFLFQSELTSNVANRTSEGIQQLFRQQS